MSILMETGRISMSSPEAPDTSLPPAIAGAGKAILSTGWLGAQSSYEIKPRMGRALVSSLLMHVGLGALVFFVMFYTPASQLIDQAKDKISVVFLQQPGPGGGGGGSPAPAPAKPLEVPHHKAPEPVAVEPTPVPKQTIPDPLLNAPVETNLANVLQASGQNSVSLATYGGGGRGGGVGSGQGNGLGEGTGGGFGGGAFRPGSGIENPTLIKQVEPKYTSEAMRAKLQGDVELDAVVLPNGTVGDIQVVKSLDRQFGLDQEAIKAARQWLFRPGTRQGIAVPVVVRLILEFRLH